MAARKRLKEIQNQLQTIPKSDPKSFELYMEASTLFGKVGNTKSAAQCRQVALKLKPLLSSLPVELIEKITMYLDMPTNLKLLQLNRALRQKMKQSYLIWKRFDLQSLAGLVGNQDFARIWKLTQGRCKSLILQRAKKLTSHFVKLIETHLPKSLETLEIQQAPKITGLSVLKLLTNKQVYLTLKKVTLVGIAGLDNFCVSKIVKFVSSLEALDITHADIDDQAFQFKDRVQSKLRMIRLDYTKVSHAGLVSLSITCTELREIYLNHCVQLDGSCVDALSTFPNLEKVSLNQIKDQIPALSQWIPMMGRFGQCPIHTLSWSGCPRLHDEGIVAFIRNALLLQTFLIDRCAGIRDQGALTLFQAPRIKHISLAYCQMYDPELLIPHLPLAIEYLDASFNPRLGDSFIEHCANLPMLRHLRIAGCPLITSNGVASLLKKQGRSFQTLDISENPTLSFDATNDLRNRFGKAFNFFVTNKR
jgi:hypothetical protein